MNWQGVWVATVTPFRDGKLDVEGFEKHLDRLISAGVDGIVPCGTTGEAPALEESEFVTVVETTLKKAAGKVHVVAGTGSNNTRHTVERTALAKKLGCEGALVVTPYYVKPTQEGLYQHFCRVAEDVDLPLMLYNVPGRTGANMLPITVDRLCRHSQIAAIKECTDLPQVAELISLVGDKIQIFSGEDGVFLPFVALGGDGIVSVAANVCPEKYVSMYQSMKKGDWVEARKEFLKLSKLIRLLFVESNPIPVKTALGRMGVISPQLRTPMAPMSKANESLLVEELKQLEMIPS